MSKKQPYWYRKGFRTGGFDWEAEAEFQGYPGVKEMLEDLYVNRGLSCQEIAKRFGMITRAGVERKIRILGIKRPVGYFEAKFKKQAEAIKALIELGWPLYKCLRALGYRAKPGHGYSTSFVKYLKAHGLVNKGSTKYPKWEIKNGSKKGGKNEQDTDYREGGRGQQN